MKCIHKNILVLFSLMLFMVFASEVSAQVPAPPEPGSTGSGQQIGGTGQIPSPPVPGGIGSQQIGGSGDIPSPPEPGGGTQIGGNGGGVPNPPEPGGGTQIGGSDTIPEPPNPGGGSGYPIGTAFQTLTIPAGWSGISSQVIPYISLLDSIFAEETQNENLVILQNFSRVFWPAFNINTIGAWDTKDGYTAKVLEDTEIEIIGVKDANDTISFVAGWNYLPIISDCDVLTEALLSELVANNQLVIVHEIAGPGLYWPEQGINTLPVLARGKAYMAKVTEDCEVNFPGCDPSETLSVPSFDLPEMPWQMVSATPVQNFLVIPDAFSSVIRRDDVVGAFTNDGICAGAVEITDAGNHAIVLYGDDPTTPVKDGFSNGESISLSLYRPATSEVIRLQFDVDGTGSTTFGIRQMREIQQIEVEITD